MIHIEPIVFTARLLPDGGRYGDDYRAVATVQKIGSVGYVSGCHGELDRKAVIDLSDELAKFGMTEVKWMRGRNTG